LGLGLGWDIQPQPKLNPKNPEIPKPDPTQTQKTQDKLNIPKGNPTKKIKKKLFLRPLSI
jgi:hypothetical protein